VERVADHDGGDVVLAVEAADGLEVGMEIGFGRAAMECEERLGGETELVGDGQADAAVADVERQDAGHVGSVRRGLSVAWRVASSEVWVSNGWGLRLGGWRGHRMRGER